MCCFPRLPAVPPLFAQLPCLVLQQPLSALSSLLGWRVFALYLGKWRSQHTPRSRLPALDCLEWLRVIFHIWYLWQTKPAISKDLSPEQLGTRSGGGMGTSKPTPGEFSSTRPWPLIGQSQVRTASQNKEALCRC